MKRENLWPEKKSDLKSEVPTEMVGQDPRGPQRTKDHRVTARDRMATRGLTISDRYKEA